MKPDDLRRDLSQSAPNKPRVLAALLLGSLALHLFVWCVIAQFPAPSAKAPQTLTEIQLRDLPAPTKAPQPPATPRPATAPRPAKIPPRRAPQTPDSPRAAPRAIAPTPPLVRSTRSVSQSGIVAKKLNVKPVVPLATAAPQARNPASTLQRAPDAISPRPRKSTPKFTIEKPSDKPVPLPTPILDASESRDKAKKSAPDSVRGSDNRSETSRSSGAESELETKKGADSGAKNGGDSAAKSDDDGGLFGLGSGPFGIGQKPRPSATQAGKPSPIPSADKGKASGESRKNGKGQSAGANKPGSAGEKSGSGGEKSGSGDGPFGLGGAVAGRTGAAPRRIVYILDVSYSMEPRLERAKAELRDALNGLRADESFNIIAFYGNVRPFEPRLVEATPRNIAEGRAFINSLRLGRYTDLERAFETAFAAPGVNVVVLITDGVPTYGLGSPDFSESDSAKVKPDIGANFGELARRVRELNSSGARIDTIGLTGKKSDGTPDRFEAAELLQRIASDSGGSFVTVRVESAPQAD